MRALVAGGGPIGIFTAMALARREYDVTLVDRDPGPTDDTWERRGVMQAQAPHAYRPAVRQALAAELPDVLAALRDAGVRMDDAPGMPEGMTPMFGRRPLVEAVLRAAARREPGLTWRTGHVEELLLDGHAARGAVVDGDPVWADIVVVATGRTSHLGDALRGPIEGGPCGVSYIFRTYRLRPGLPLSYCPTFPSFGDGPGYISLMMPADAGTHHVLLAYPSRSAEFGFLRTNEGFERAARTVPNLAPWADPDHFEPLGDTQVGGNLTNTYRLQGPALGMPPAAGLFFLGDTVLTTNPAAGRNLALVFPHARVLLAALDDPAKTSVDASLDLDRWAEEHMRPWFLDHVHWDATLLRRFEGRDLDLEDRIPSDVIAAAAEVDRSLMAQVGPYQAMRAGPDVLRPVEERVRSLLRDGWRPRVDGPTAAEMAELVGA